MRVIAIICLFFLSYSAFSQARRALNLFEKDKIEDAIELLRKTIAKDSLAPAEKYILADYLFEPDSVQYDLDSAYFYILEAQIDFAGLEEKDQQKLIDNGFGPELYSTLKGEIEHAAFERAKEHGKATDFSAFMIDFATSNLIDSAIYYRNKRAFRDASELDTYQSYNLFFNTYPDALDVQEAKKRYEYLLFREKTGTGKLADYQSFLQRYPDTWHRKETEQAIFNIITGRNSSDAYQSFIKQYPDSFLNKAAALRWYALLNDSEKVDFTQKGYLKPQTIDSLEVLRSLNNQLFILSQQDNIKQLINREGNVVLSTTDEISNASKCNESLQLLQTQSKGKSTLVNLNGTVIISDNFLSYSELDRGFLALNYSDGKVIVHQNGDPTSGKKYQDAKITGHFISYQNGDFWGLESITGIVLVEPQFDTIFQFSDRIILAKDDRYGIFSSDEFYPLLDQNSLDLKLPYTAISTLRYNRLLVQQDSLYSLYDEKIVQLVPFADQSIELLEDGYFLDAFDSILDSRVARRWYRDITSNETWTLGFIKDSVDVYYKNEKVFVVEDANLIGSSALLVTTGNLTSCYFTDSVHLSLAEGDVIQPIRKMGQKSTSRHYILTKANRRQFVINRNGERIALPKFDKLSDLGDDYMIFAIKGLVYNILDNKGKIVLRDVDAATSIGRGYISFLADGRFGLFNSFDGTFINAKYDRPIQSYDEKYFIVKKDGLQGLIDRADSIVVPLRYSDIRFYNDSIAVLNNNFRWTFWNVKDGSVLLDNVSDYWELDFDSKNLIKFFKGVGYGIWSPSFGVLLNSTYSEITLKSRGTEAVFVAEKWVEEADLVILLYYNSAGDLINKSVLTTAQFESLQCDEE